MRISDWSSDVCSSDLRNARVEVAAGIAEKAQGSVHQGGIGRPAARRRRLQRSGHAIGAAPRLHRDLGSVENQAIDRKSVVSGKSVSVRVELGGRRRSKKKQNTHKDITVKERKQ